MKEQNQLNIDSFMWGVTKRKEGECWIWQRAKTNRGKYGEVYWRLADGKTKMIGAHVASWLIFKGSIPEGMYVLHKCDVGTCVNPDHLEVGTQGKNLKDGYARNRRKSTRRIALLDPGALEYPPKERGRRTEAVERR
jgi:hypothetical protein